VGNFSYITEEEAKYAFSFLFAPENIKNSFFSDTENREKSLVLDTENKKDT
jgi:hypothetical protein